MNDNNTHSVFAYLGDGITAFIDGIPDKCEHDSDGHGYHFVSYTREYGSGFVEYIPDTGQTHEDIEALDNDLRKAGKYISGGCVSCSKCGKPFSPPIF